MRCYQAKLEPLGGSFPLCSSDLGQQSAYIGDGCGLIFGGCKTRRQSSLKNESFVVNLEELTITVHRLNRCPLLKLLADPLYRQSSGLGKVCLRGR
jgi:hypothetical protein